MYFDSSIKIIFIVIAILFATEILLMMDQLLSKINFDKILDKVMEYSIDSYIFYHDSIESYYSRKEPTLWRKIKFYLTFLLMAVFNVKYGLLSLYPDQLQWTTLKDATLIFGKQANLVHAMLFSLGMVAILGKLVMVYYEGRKNLKIFDLIVDWKARKPGYQLSHEQLKKIKLRAFILYYAYIRIIGSIAYFILTSIVVSITIVSYLYHDYGNVIILWFWSIIVITTFNQIFIIILIGTFMFYVPISIINYRFDELIKNLRVSIRWNNEQALHQVLENYNEAIAIVQNLSGPYNMIIGLVYCLVPYIIAISLELTKIDRDDLLFQLLKLAFLTTFILTNVNAFIINQISASITVRNKSIPRYLYPVFARRGNARIRMKLELESFIARLNTEYIGYYCLNLFKFTKMAFYQYAFSVSTCYFLIANVSS